jgi:hypothetical protein
VDSRSRAVGKCFGVYQKEELRKRGIVYFYAYDVVAESFLWPATEGEPRWAFCNNLPAVARLTLRQGQQVPRAFCLGE